MTAMDNPDWAHCAEHAVLTLGCTACWAAILRHGQLRLNESPSPSSVRLDMRTLYDEFDDLQTRPACPECHRRTRDALQLGAIFGWIMLVLGGLLGWLLHGVVLHGWRP